MEEALATARQHAYLAGAPPPDPSIDVRTVVSYEVSPNGFNATYSITNEDHTLGNVLRSVLAENMDCSFVGYSVPHPAESLIKLRLQRYVDSVEEQKSTSTSDMPDLEEEDEDGNGLGKSLPVHELMHQGLEDLVQMCEVVQEKYVTACARVGEPAAAMEDDSSDSESDE